MENKEILAKSIQVLKEYTQETDDEILDEYTLNEIGQNQENKEVYQYLKKVLYENGDPVDDSNDIRHINIDYTVDLILEEINR